MALPWGRAILCLGAVLRRAVWLYVGVVAATRPLPHHSPIPCPLSSLMDNPCEVALCWTSCTASWKRRKRARLCVVRWAFRHALALKGELARAWGAPLSLLGSETVDLGVLRVSEEKFSDCTKTLQKNLKKCTEQPRQHRARCLLLCQYTEAKKRTETLPKNALAERGRPTL